MAEDINDKCTSSSGNASLLGAAAGISLEVDKSTKNVLEGRNCESNSTARKRKRKNCGNTT